MTGRLAFIILIDWLPFVFSLIDVADLRVHQRHPCGLACTKLAGGWPLMPMVLELV
jgi:hypothetical protein